MKRMALCGLVLVAGLAWAVDNTTPARGTIVGVWAKDRATKEGGAYPDDQNWQLTVSFLENGRFIWKSTRTESQEVTDPATGKKSTRKIATAHTLQGTYVIEKQVYITFHFDPVPPADQGELDTFAYWPKGRIGKLLFSMKDGELLLRNEGGKLSMFMKPTA